MHDLLPPVLTPDESAKSVEVGGERWNAGKMRVVNRVEIDPDTEIRLIRRHCLRQVVESDGIRIYHCMDNTRDFHAVDEQSLEVEPLMAPAIEHLCNAYPKYVTVESLPLGEADSDDGTAPGLDTLMRLVQDLWERKLIVTRRSLKSHYDD